MVPNTRPTTPDPGPTEGVALRDALAAHAREERRGRTRYEPRTEPGGPPVLDLSNDAPREADTDSPSSSVASLVRRANHDELTGLANRSWFVAAADRMRNSAAACATAGLFLIDLDGFKAVNDTWGHGAGDQVLIAVGERLQGLFRHSAVAARFGGDEFALWVADCSESQARLVADRIVSAITEPIPGELMLTVGASVGWVIADGSTPLNALLSRADIALYSVKERGGRGHQMFNRELAAERLQGRVLLRELRQGFASDQFVLATQPIVDAAGVPQGHEVLARWEHPRRGLLQPASFLPMVKASGTTRAFDQHIVSLAVAQACAHDDNQPLWINLTEESLDQEMVDRLTEIVDNDLTGGTPLVIEISEEAPAESAEAREAIEQIAALGIAIAIDDFGSGYSRLGAMTRLPISYVKIDRQFVGGLHQTPARREVLQAVIDLIHAIGASAVAEGVENERDAETLRALGCELLQGWHFGRPELVSEREVLSTATD